MLHRAVRHWRWWLMAGVMMAASVLADECLLPLMDRAPTVDGHIMPAEWQASAGFDGFSFNDKAQRRRVRAFIGATADTLYVAVVSQLPVRGELAAAVNTDSLKAVHDDSVEVYIDPNPGAADRVTYQFLTNSKGKGGYNIHVLGKGRESPAWRGDWRQSHGFHDGWWHFECAIPIHSMSAVAAGRKTTDGVWGINLARNWKNPWEWSSLTGEYATGLLPVRFTAEPAPAIQYLSSTGHDSLPYHGVLTLRNPGKTPLTLKASMVLGRNNMPELRQERIVALAPGTTEEFVLNVPEHDPASRFVLDMAVSGADGTPGYWQRRYAWTAAASPFVWHATAREERPPVDFRFAHYPYRHLLRLLLDLRGLPDEARVTDCLVEVRPRHGGEPLKTLRVPWEDFVDGQAERRLSVDLPHGDYEIAVRVQGEKAPAGEVVKTFERHVFPWENLPVGRSTTVYPPFTPIELDGKALRTVLRHHTLNDLGLLDQVAATSANTGVTRAVLSGPMRYRVTIGGVEQPVRAEPLRVISSAPHEVVTVAAFSAGALAASARTHWDYDGTARVDLTLSGGDAATVDALTLEIPLAETPGQPLLLHANADRIRAPVALRIGAEDGAIWDATQVAYDDFQRNFCPYAYVGTAVRGLCWFADNDRGWGWDPETPNLTLRREDGTVVLRVHLVNRATRLATPRTLTFGLLAAPVKPPLVKPGEPRNWWRYRYYRDHYTLLGTDVNWLSIGTCGSVYPAGGNLFLWEMLARGNREQLDADTIRTVEEIGRQYFEPYGAAKLEIWKRHVNYNLRSRYGKKMIFYYNRASHQACEEFETFKDEWCLTDYRSVGKGNGIGEIKIVPSDSYVDFCLYWYARSFEIGANQGVYWDNFFIAPSFNTECTDAYQRQDGGIVPAGGIWALRELARRTFVMMNERGMLPITFPHMTSFSPLPMLAFCTVQYDWEWKYSRGDVQDRHAREYLQLASTGELAGVWPVPLSDHGELGSDEWTQRTFTGVRLVHELDGYGGCSPTGNPALVRNFKLLEPVLKVLEAPTLRVYKYWEDRPLPADAGREDLPCIVYAVPGREAVIGVTSYAREDARVQLHLDLEALELRNARIADVESGASLPVNDGVCEFPLKAHGVRVLRVTAGTSP